MPRPSIRKPSTARGSRSNMVAKTIISKEPPYIPVSQTDVTVLYGMLRAQQKHERKLVSAAEIYPFCKQDPKNVRWVLARLKNKMGIISNQQVKALGKMWVWCGKRSLPQFLLDVLSDKDALKPRPDTVTRMVRLSDMVQVIRRALEGAKAEPAKDVTA